MTCDDSPGVRPVVIAPGALASLELDDLHQLLDEGWGQRCRGTGVNEVHQMPYMSGCGADSEPSRGGIAARAHVLDDPLRSQDLVEVVGVRPWLCFEHRIRPAGQLDARGHPIAASV